MPCTHAPKWEPLLYQVGAMQLATSTLLHQSTTVLPPRPSCLVMAASRRAPAMLQLMHQRNARVIPTAFYPDFLQCGYETLRRAQTGLSLTNRAAGVRALGTTLSTVFSVGEMAEAKLQLLLIPIKILVQTIRKAF